MASRGLGGCGGTPVLWEQEAPLTSCSQRCLQDPQCIKVQRVNQIGKCSASSATSHVQSPEPNGQSGYSCSFKQTTVGAAGAYSQRVHMAYRHPADIRHQTSNTRGQLSLTAALTVTLTLTQVPILRARALAVRKPGPDADPRHMIQSLPSSHVPIPPFDTISSLPSSHDPKPNHTPAGVT